MRDAYRRRISAEEAREGFVFITKDAVRFFPPVGEEFEVRAAGATGRTRLAAVPCQCVGEPHEHYHLGGLSDALPFPLVKGSRVEIRRLPTGGYEAVVD